MVTRIPSKGNGTVKQRDRPPKTKRKFCPKRARMRVGNLWTQLERQQEEVHNHTHSPGLNTHPDYTHFHGTRPYIYVNWYTPIYATGTCVLIHRALLVDLQYLIPCQAYRLSTNCWQAPSMDKLLLTSISVDDVLLINSTELINCNW